VIVTAVCLVPALAPQHHRHRAHDSARHGVPLLFAGAGRETDSCHTHPLRRPVPHPRPARRALNGSLCPRPAPFRGSTGLAGVLTRPAGLSHPWDATTYLPSVRWPRQVLAAAAGRQALRFASLAASSVRERFHEALVACDATNRCRWGCVHGAAAAATALLHNHTVEHTHASLGADFQHALYRLCDGWVVHRLPPPARIDGTRKRHLAVEDVHHMMRHNRIT